MNNPLTEFRPESLNELLSETQEDYWRFARKGPRDFSVYTERSSIYETPTKEKFRESTDVLVRWTDGLLYLATIIQVEEEYSRCAVKFEDGSQFWALFKDIFKGPLPENEFACTVCDSSSSQPPDEIVICDKCSVGYHQMCHVPKIATTDLNPDIPWSCRKCVFASATKKGGASKKGANAQAMLLMKETLPYHLDSLTWDASHKSNLQQTYCYCGGPGEWFSKMLQCLRCKQWFHEACLQCLDDSLLYGDRFYIFVCTVCNKGPEFLRRLPVRWPDIAHLVLFNLTVMHGKKFFDFDTTIMTFLRDNWSKFLLKGESVYRLQNDEKKKKLLEHLQNSKSRFTSNKDVKKKSCVWGLRSRIPPPVPAVTLPDSGVITNDVLDSFNASSRKSKSVVKSNNTPLSLKRLRKPSEQEDREDIGAETAPKAIESRNPKAIESRKIEKPVTKAEKTVEPPPPSEDTSESALQQQTKKERRKLPHRHAKLPKQPNKLKSRKLHRISNIIDFTESDDTSSSHGTLNSIIPYPVNFEGLNNPFLNNSSRNYSAMTSNSEHPLLSYSRRTSNSERLRPSNFSETTSNSSPADSETDSFRPRSDSRLRARPFRKYTTPSDQDICSKPEEESVIDSLLKNDKTDIGHCSTVQDSSADLTSSVSSYFGMADRIESGEKYSVLARRTLNDGKVQYLVEWDGVVAT